MKLTIENCPDHKWIEKAFWAVANRLGIADADWTVNVRVDGMGMLPPGSGGFTAYDPEHPGRCLIVLGAQKNPTQRSAPGEECFSMIEVFCHELVHVKQHIKDGLAGDIRRFGNWWRGKFYSDDEEQILTWHGGPRAVPWEDEAYGRMRELADEARRAL